MKITEITLTAITYPAPHPLRWGRGERTQMGGTIVQVQTDEGLVGVGDACAGLAAVLQTLERPLTMWPPLRRFCWVVVAELRR